MPKFQTYGECLRGFATELWKLLQLLGGYDRPLYQSTNWITFGRIQGMHIKMTIYAREKTKASHPMYFHARRAAEEDGIQETSRLAMLHLCHIHANELNDAVFYLHPRAQVVDHLAQYSAIDEGDATIVHLARFVTAQEKAMVATLEELRGAYEIIEIVECRVAELEDAL